MGHTIGSEGPLAWRELDALVTEVVSTRREIARLQAAEARLLADAVDLVIDRTAQRRALRRATDHDLPLREVAAELGAAMRVSDRAVQHRLGDAAALVSRFPATLTAFEEGRIDQGHVSAILDAGALIADDETRARYESHALDAAASETPGRLRALVRAMAAQLAPEAAAARATRAAADRRVRLTDLDDDLARLIVDLPAVLGHAIFDRLTEQARALKSTPDGGEDAGYAAADGADDSAGDETTAAAGTGDDDAADAADAGGRIVVLTGPTGDPDREADDPSDTRTMDQLRADILTDLLLAGAPAAHGGDALAAIRARVQVTIPVLTLAGIDDQPALLVGHGPIDPDTARRLAASAPGWDRVMTHPYTGEPLAVDRYRPTAALDRFLKARDERCRAPGCTRPVHRCDIDHNIDAAKGGRTCPENNCHFCRRHHTLKHATAWTVRQLPGGVIEWTSPTGRAYRDRPPGTVRFIPTDWLHPAPAPGEPPPPF